MHETGRRKMLPKLLVLSVAEVLVLSVAEVLVLSVAEVLIPYYALK